VTTKWTKLKTTLRWAPASAFQQLTRKAASGPVHFIIALADHFEPAILPGTPHLYASRSVQEERLERWCREYPKMVDRWRDAEGRSFSHTYFYPAEQYDRNVIQPLAEHCRAGWGEIEIQLHHGVEAPDTESNTRRILIEVRDALAEQGCLSGADGAALPRYCFVHGNFALANSGLGCCGVDGEMQILAETGCFADFTLPSAPNPSQVAKINALYEPVLPLGQRAPHRRGRDLECGRPPQVFPLVVEGPLMLRFSRSSPRWPLPCLENSALTGVNPPSLERLLLWRRVAITVQGRPDWVFIKLHCHGMDPRDEAAMLGPPMLKFLQDVSEESKRGKAFQAHYVTAREMVNIALAACDGREGNPGDYRDYRFRLVGFRKDQAPHPPAQELAAVGKTAKR